MASLQEIKPSLHLYKHNSRITRLQAFTSSLKRNMYIYYKFITLNFEVTTDIFS